MKISIVTPSYNQGRYIRTCINSVLTQSYRNIEHIVIDGGSTDETIGILNEIQNRDKRLFYVSEPDRGQGDAVNKGIQLASGEIVAWINSDDFYFDQEVFDRIINYFNNKKGIDIVYGRMIYVDKENKIMHVRLPPKYSAQNLKYVSYIGNTNTFFRKRVVETHKLDIDYHYVIDHEYMLRITRDFVAESFDTDVACFRVHNEAKTQTLSSQIKSAERLRRDIRHKINRTTFFYIHLFLFRVKYKISLIYADFLYLETYRAKASISPLFKNL